MPSVSEWDERFRRGDHASSAADPFLGISQQYWPLLPGWSAANDSEASGSTTLRALDVASGAGRHAVSLAEAGFRVTAIDFSSEGLAAARRLAESRGLSIETRQADLEAAEVDLGEQIYDLVAVFFFLHRPLFTALRRCLRKHGLLIYKTYSVDQLQYPGRPRHPMYFLEHNELLSEFADFRVLRYEEEWQGRGTAALIAQKR